MAAVGCAHDPEMSSGACPEPVVDALDDAECESITGFAGDYCAEPNERCVLAESVDAYCSVELRLFDDGSCPSFSQVLSLSGWLAAGSGAMAQGNAARVSFDDHPDLVYDEFRWCTSTEALGPGGVETHTVCDSLLFDVPGEHAVAATRSQLGAQHFGADVWCCEGKHVDQVSWGRPHPGSYTTQFYSRADFL